MRVARSIAPKYWSFRHGATCKLQGGCRSYPVPSCSTPRPPTARRSASTKSMRRRENRVRLRVDEETGDEVAYDDIIKGYEVSKGNYLEVTDS
jgi:hypothetical protein